MALLTFAAAIASLVSAAPFGLSGPVEGFAFDMPTRSFRPVIGLPGSATFGDAIIENCESGSVAPKKDYGIAFRDGQAVAVRGLNSSDPTVTPLTGVNPDPEGIVWSGDGSIAAIYSISAKWLQTVSGFPDAGAVSTPTDLQALPGSLSALAVDQAGKRVAIGIAGDTGAVYLIDSGSAPIPLAGSSKPVALAFSGDGAQLFWIDATTLQVTNFGLADFTSESFALEGITDPVAIQSKPGLDNRQLIFVASRSDRRLQVYEASGHQLTGDLSLDASPSELSDFGRNSMVLNRRANPGDALWLVTTIPQPDIHFVPAIVSASGEPRQ